MKLFTKKKLFIISIIIILLFVGCKNEKNVLETKDINLADEKELNIAIYYPTFFGESQPKMSSMVIEQWENFVSDIGKANIKFDYIDASFQKEMLDSIEKDRLIYIWDIQQLKVLIENDMIIPINNYIGSLSNFTHIKNSIIKNFTDSNGNIWALPTYTCPIYTYRRYNNDLLEKLQVNIPTSIEEFEKLAKKAKSKSKDISDKGVFLFNIEKPQGRTFSSLMDIFVAYGCYPNIKGILNIVYNQETGGYEDIVYDEKFVKALTFIRYLIDNEFALYTGEISHSDLDSKYEFISGNHINYDCEISLGFYLKGENSKKLIIDNSYVRGIAVLKETKNIVDKLSYFTERVFVDKELQEAYNFGIKGYHFEEFDTYYLKKTEYDGKLKPFSPIKINVLNNIRDEKYVFMEGNSYEDNLRVAELVRKGEIEFAELRENNNENIYTYNLFKNIDTKAYKLEIQEDGTVIYPIDIQIQINFDKLLEEIFSGSESIENAINNYTLKLNSEDYLMFMNNLNKK